MRRRIVLTAIAALALASVPAVAVAGKGGNGNGGGNGGGGGSTPSSAWVSASPNPASAGSTVWVQGCGYDTNHAVELRITHPDGSLETYGVGVWYTGCMNPTPISEDSTGTYSLEVYQQSSPTLRLKASTSLNVG